MMMINERRKIQEVVGIPGAISGKKKEKKREKKEKEREKKLRLVQYMERENNE